MGHPPSNSRCLYDGLSVQEKARAAVANAFAANGELFAERFRVRKIVGFGANGVVLAAHCADARAGVAIKIIYKRRAGGIDARPPPEVAVLRRVAAPFIVRSLADWQDRNHFYLVTELFGAAWLDTVTACAARALPLPPVVFTTRCRNRTVAHSLPIVDGSSDLWAYALAARTHIFQVEGHSLLPLEPVKRIIKQTASALSALHEQGYYHGDVKCENILVDQTQDAVTNIRLADFGHSREFAGGINSYGTRAISPTEFLEDSPFDAQELDGRCSDVFALGMVLFSLLNDKGVSAPAQSRVFTKYDEILAQDDGRYPITGISELDQEGWDLLHKMCMVDPTQRISVHQVLCHVWLQDVDL
ncbi:kinase-like domain-containing protein [Obelidium mucronatum]|nr:kinase-like domain-containing protein [Obelidium mucronatum]